MKYQVKDQESIDTHHDVMLSVIIGPLKFLVPVAGYLILYPIMLKKSGVEIIGLWSLLTTIVSYISLTDLGFSLLLTREAGKDRSKKELNELFKDYIASQRLYMIMCLVLLTIFLIVHRMILSFLGSIYPGQAFLLSIFLLIIASTLYLVAKLDAAILSARNENYYIQLITAITPVFVFSSAIYGSWLGRPIEGYSFGTLLASITEIFAYRWKLLNSHQQWVHSRAPITWRATFNQIQSLIHRGWHFYSISLGFVFREPIFRWILALTLGLETVGIYSIANRLTLTARNLIASGFSALYPSLAYFNRLGKKEETKDLLQVSLLFLLSLGAGSIGLLIMMADIIISLWLGEVPKGLIISIKILGLWNVLTIANVPFWYLLQASGYEKKASLSLWLHTFSIFFLIPLHKIINISLFFALSYWLLSALFTQIMICFYVERKLSIFWESVLNQRIIILMILIVAFLSVALTTPLSLPTKEIPIFSSSWLFRLIPIVFYAIAAAFILWLPLREYFFRKRKVVAKL